jgi:iron(III) transport system substrate-binding protein
MKKKWILSLFAVLLLLIFAACGNDSATNEPEKEEPQQETGTETEKPATEEPAKVDEASGNVVVYTARDQTVVDKVVDMFNEKYPDVQVDVLTMGAQQILERVRGEKSNPGGDFWWGGTQSAFITATNEELLEPFKPSFDANIKPEHKDSAGHWYGEMLLPEVIMFNSDVLTKETAPQDWDELLDEAWADEILIRDVLPSGTMRTIYSSMIFRLGADNPDAGFEWLEKLDANTKEYVQDPTNLYLKMARQEGSVSVWNLQDILIQRHAQNQPFDFVMPESGAPILVDAVGIIKGAKNMENAKLFYEFLFDPETVAQLSEETYQIPARTDIDAASMPEWYKELEINELELDWNIMAEKEMEWMEHWDANIKGRN